MLQYRTDCENPTRGKSIKKDVAVPFDDRYMTASPPGGVFAANFGMVAGQDYLYKIDIKETSSCHLCHTGTMDADGNVLDCQKLHDYGQQSWSDDWISKEGRNILGCQEGGERDSPESGVGRYIILRCRSR